MSEWPEYINWNNATDDGGGNSIDDDMLEMGDFLGPLPTDPPELIGDTMPNINVLTDEQEILLSALQVASAFLSLTGSCIIVFKILRGLYKSQSTTPYDRIILGLSCCDIVASATYGVSPFLLPRETSQRIWAMGSAETCEFLGFLTQLSALWAIWYNCVLSFYYLLTVRFKVKREILYRKYELWMHLSGAIFFPLTALVGLFGNFYGEQALIINCWVRSVGEAGGIGTEIAGYTFGGLPIVITFLALVINNIIIYRHVRKTLLSSSSQSSNHHHPVTIAAAPNNNPDSENQSGALSMASRSSDGQKSIKEKLAREAAIQGFLYVSCFFLSCTPIFVLVVLDGSMGYDTDDKAQLYPLLVLNSLLVPLQGFFNVFIYVRPSYSRFAAAHPDKPFWFVLRLALFESNIPRLTSVAPSSLNNINNGSHPSRMVSLSLSSSIANKNNNSAFAIALDKKHSQLKSKCASNFETSLNNIVEEEDMESSEL